MLSRKIFTRSLGSLWAAVFLLPVAVSAGPIWTARGLEGLSISSLAVDPGSPSRIYAAAGDGGIYRSSDGGASWTQANLGRAAEKVEIDPRDGTIYSISGARLYRSGDHGETWTKLDFSGQVWTGREWLSSSTSEPVWSVAVNASDSGALYAGHSGASVSTSRDGGSTWSSSYFDYYCSDFCAEAITTLALDPASRSTVYAGIDADADYPGFAEMFKSTDGGKNWKQSDTGLVLWSSVYSIVVDPNDSERVFAGTSAGTYVSLNAGGLWGKTSSSVSRALAADPWNPVVVYVGTDHDGVLRSSDRGQTWSAMSPGLPSVKILSLAVDRARGLLLAGTADGVFSYAIAETRDAFLDIFDDGDRTGFLLYEAFGRFRLGSADSSGGKSLDAEHGPYAGWAPLSGASGSDGATRVLWTSDDGSAALWLTRPEGIQAAFLFPAQPGWTARDVAAGEKGSTRILWTADASASLWTVSASGVRTGDYGYGPYPGWSASGIAGGPDGRTRILWNNADGRAGVSFVDSQGLLETTRYGPDSGWTFVDLAVGAENHTRLLRSHADGRIAVWRIDEAGTVVSSGTVYPAPAGFRAARVAAGTDGLTRVLWRDSSGVALVWLLTADGQFQASFPLN